MDFIFKKKQLLYNRNMFVHTHWIYLLVGLRPMWTTKQCVSESSTASICNMWVHIDIVHIYVEVVDYLLETRLPVRTLKAFLRSVVVTQFISYTSVLITIECEHLEYCFLFNHAVFLSVNRFLRRKKTFVLFSIFWSFFYYPFDIIW